MAALALENAQLRLSIPQDFGPRILGLYVGNSPNLLAELPDNSVETPHGRYYFRGGHRLWHAPEQMPRTYLPDNEPPSIQQHDSSIHLKQAPEPLTHIQKEMLVTLHENRVSIRHSLRNEGLMRVALAPWAITQLAPGGTAVLPQNSAKADPGGYLPNRSLVLWPYSRLSDPRLRFTAEAVQIEADPAYRDGPFKLGYANPAGWQGYYRPDLRLWFIKSYQHQPGAVYPDMGCSTECYVNEQFIELESLAPLVTLDAGESCSHEEHWHLWPEQPFEALPDLVAQSLYNG